MGQTVGHTQTFTIENLKDTEVSPMNALQQQQQG